jgi:hypothetical protein
MTEMQLNWRRRHSSGRLRKPRCSDLDKVVAATRSTYPVTLLNPGLSIAHLHVESLPG